MIQFFVVLMLFIGGFVSPVVHAAKDAPVEATYSIDGSDIELARYAKALIGTGNITVEIAPYTKGYKEGAILLFKGVEGDWDGKALNHQVTTLSNGGKNYVFNRNGKDWVTLVVRKDDDGKTTYELNVPDMKDTVMLAPSDGAAQATNPRKIFEEFKKQNPTK